MFTGIIQELGKILKVEKGKNSTRFTVQTKNLLHDKKIGDSIAVNGTCITITGIKKTTFAFEAIAETLTRTNLQSIKKDSKVNLETALRSHQSLDGHIVQGHIDTTGTVKSLHNNRLTINFPPNIAKYLAFKGSITVNGVSLTISDLEEENFSVDLIPHTAKTTNLGDLKKGDQVNLEVDLIARYLESLLNNRDKEATYEFLKERNLL